MNGRRIREADMNIRLTFSFVSGAFFALAATGLAFKTDPAIAQQAAEAIEEIVVEAPIVRRQVGRATGTNAKIEIIELRRRVSFADLDISRYEAVIELEARIQTIAKEACEKLFEMYPSTPPDRLAIKRCTEQAIDGTEEKVQAAIAAASG
jgi:UrcA family protein